MTDEARMAAGWNFRRQAGKVAGVAFACPGCGSESWVSVDGEKWGPDHAWQWDGNKTAPTLRPSLGQRCCKWHGYLTAGVFVPC